MIDYETVWKLLDASLTSRQTMWQNYQTVYGVTFLRRAEESLTVTWRELWKHSITAECSQKGRRRRWRTVRQRTLCKLSAGSTPENEERCGTGRYRAVPSKRGHQKALQICVSFESCDAQNSQESDRMTAGEWGEGIRVENINYSIIMCDAQWEKEGSRRRRGRGGGRARVCLRQWENFVWQQWLICGKNIPQRVTEKLWTPDTSRHWGTERGRTIKKKRQKNSKQRKILFVCHRII